MPTLPIKVSISVSVYNGDLKFSKSFNYSAPMIDRSYCSGTVDVGPSYTTIPSTVVDQGVAYIANLSEFEAITVAIKVGATYTPFAYIPAGEADTYHMLIGGTYAVKIADNDEYGSNTGVVEYGVLSR